MLELPENGLDRSECLGRARLGQGRISEAVQLLTSAVDRGVPAGHPIRGYLGYAYGRAGRREEAEKLAAAVSANPFQQALTFAGLGDKDRTLEALERMAPLGPVRLAGPYLSGICSRSRRSTGESSSQEGRITRVAAFGFTNHDKRSLRVCTCDDVMNCYGLHDRCRLKPDYICRNFWGVMLWFATPFEPGC